MSADALQASALVLATDFDGLRDRSEENARVHNELRANFSNTVRNMEKPVFVSDARDFSDEQDCIQHVRHSGEPPLRETTEPEHGSLSKVNPPLQSLNIAGRTNRYGCPSVIPSHRGTFQAVEFTQRVVCGGKLLPLFKLCVRPLSARSNGAEVLSLSSAPPLSRRP